MIDVTVQLRMPFVKLPRRAAAAVDARINAAEEACVISITVTHEVPRDTAAAAHGVSSFVGAVITMNAHAGVAEQEIETASPAEGSEGSVTMKGARSAGKDDTATAA
jgi:hypothetical protein